MEARAVCRVGLAAALFLWFVVSVEAHDASFNFYQQAIDNCDINHPGCSMANETNYVCVGGTGCSLGTRHYFVPSNGCPGGYVMVELGWQNFVCQIIPSTCLSGETFDVSYYTDTGSAGGYLRMISLSSPEVTTNIDGCEVTYTPNYDDCYYSGEIVAGPSGDFERTVCNVLATKTGNSSSVQTEETAGLSSGDSSSLGNKCIAGADGDVFCADINPQNCGEINGVDVCFNGGSVSCYDIGGTTICAGGAQNCGIFNGENLCVEQVETESFVKFSDGSKEVLLSKDKGQVTTTVATVDNGDGTITKTTTMTSNMVGVPSSVKTEMFDAAGNLISSTETGADGPDQGTQEFDKGGLATEVGQNSMISELQAIKESLDPAVGADVSGIEAEEGNFQTSLDAAYAGVESGLVSSELGSSDFLTWGISWPSQTCTPMTQTVTTVGGVGITLDIDPCTRLAPFRLALGWMMYIGTVLGLLYMAASRIGR